MRPMATLMMDPLGSWLGFDRYEIHPRPRQSRSGIHMVAGLRRLSLTHGIRGPTPGEHGPSRYVCKPF